MHGVNHQELLGIIKQLNFTVDKLKNKNSEPIAVIGMSCRFPGGANSIDEYWELLTKGQDAIIEVPNDRWELSEYYNPDPDVPDKMYCKWGGFLNNNIKDFDAKFFGIAPLEAQMMDPQQRLALEVTWEALESAAIVANKLVGTKTGVFMGASTSDYLQIIERGGEISAYTNSGIAHSVLAGRISYELGLQGPSLVVDTACSSSLVAIHQACTSLRKGESNLAIAGGVNLMLTPDLTIGFCKGKFLAPDGRCKTFDESADGYVRGEGCGVIVLKRFSDAKRDGDNILAIIRGSAVNQDGASGGLTVPNGPAQESVIIDALIDANVKPHEIGYVEAHGTGTSLGDPIEINAIEHVLKEGRSKDQELIIASVKTNIGHLEAAAGMASIIKVILSLQHQEIPKHLHFNKLNHNIVVDENVKFTIPTENIKWPRGANSRIAGVSGFAFQGTNAHLIIEEAPIVNNLSKIQYGAIDRTSHILTLSAKSNESLRALSSAYMNLLTKNSKNDNYMADICFSANNYRCKFNHRLAMVSTNALDAKLKLQNWLDNGQSNGITSGEVLPKNNHKIAFLFSGQGVQYAGMGRELYETNLIFKNYLDICADILIKNNYLDKPLLSLLWGENSKFIYETKYTQPVLFAFEYALYQLWLSWGITPSAVIGYSVGEYVAACVAGVFNLEDGLKLISKRAALIQALPQNGAMAAIAEGEEVILEATKPFAAQITIAAVNGPESVVISGNVDAVKKLTAEFAAKGIKTKELQVSHAFHSHLLEPMLSEFEIVLKDIKLSKPTISLISNLTGSEVSSDDIITAAYWVKHTRNAVRFNGGINTLINIGITNFIEIGPQPVLLGMVQECLQESSNKLFLPSLRKDKDNWAQMLESLSALYVEGVEINWVKFDQDYVRFKVQLPTYQFQRQSYWIEAKEKSVKQLHDQYKADNLLLGKIFHTPVLNDSVILEANYTDKDQFVNDHRIFNLAVVPGSAHLARILCGAVEIYNRNFVNITEIEFQQPIVITDNANVRVQLIINQGNNGNYYFEIFSTVLASLNTTEWIKHIEGQFNFDESNFITDENQSILDIKSRCNKKLDINVFNDYFYKNNFQYGHSFKWISQIYLGNNECICFMRAPSVNDNLQGLILHPGQIDCAFQASAAFGLASGKLLSDGTPRILAGVAGFKLFNIPKGNLVCHVVHSLSGISDSDDKSASFDITIYDENSNIVALIEKLTVAKISKEQLLRNLKNDVYNKQVMSYYKVVWQESHTLEINKVAIDIPSTWLLVSDKSSMAINVSETLINNGYKTEIVNPDDIDVELSNIIKSGVNNIDGVIYLVPNFKEDITHGQQLGYGVVLNILQKLMLYEKQLSCKKFVVITANAVAVSQHENVNPFQAPVWGLGKVIFIEAPEVEFKLIDIDSNTEVSVSNIINEIISYRVDNMVALRSNLRLAPKLVRDKLLDNQTWPALNLKTAATYLITGGFGALGLLFAKHLIDCGAKSIVLVGRHEVSKQALDSITKLKESGATIVTKILDIANANGVHELISDISTNMPELKGIIHTAGSLDDAPLIKQDFAKYNNIISSKILGTWNLHNASLNVDLDFFVMFSSIAAVIGNIGQANYAAANAFMDAVAIYRKNLNLAAISINWGPWADIGMAANLNNATVHPLSIDDGIKAFDTIVVNNAADAIVMDVDWSLLQQTGTLHGSYYDTLFVKNYSQNLINNELVVKLLAASKGDRINMITELVRGEVARVLGYDSLQKVDINKPLVDHGLDSLMAVTLRNSLKKILGDNITLKSTLIFDYPTVVALVGYIDKNLADESSETGFLPKAIEFSKSSTDKKNLNEEIAIIGASCRFPGGANSLSEYWDLLIHGKDAIIEVPSDRWSLEEYYDPNPDAPRKMYCKWGGFLNTKIQEFDAKFFDIIPSEAKMLDPQQRLALEVTWEAIENAGMNPIFLKNTMTGVFFGVSTSDYTNIVRDSGDITAYTNSGASHSVLAGRISYELGLQGPSLVLDTACSSSLVAIHQASRSLREGESNLAIVGGVNLMLTPDTTIGFCKGGFLSIDGRCKTFDESANGYVRGEGCGVIILKRLPDATRDGDNILAIIKGSAVNQDGASAGLTVPNGPAQETVITQALIDANVKPSDINYVEAHGTGTSLGDPIEVHALESVLKEDRSKAQELIIASVKTNIGHLEAAAGMASIIKVILALQNQTIPKHLHFHKLNHNISIDEDINIIIPTENIEWLRGTRRRIAGISGFAFQGTNAHIIVEEYLESPKINSQVDRNQFILCLSAKNNEAIRDLVNSYDEQIFDKDNLELGDICYSANTGRAHFEQRLAVVADTSAEMMKCLTTWLKTGRSVGVVSGSIENIEQKTAFLFTGQGSQYIGMGKELYYTSPIFKKTLDLCAEILNKKNYLDKPLLSILWGDDSNLIDETKYTQPVLFAFEYALSQLWQSCGIIPDVVIGHSVGEYVAATIAEVFSLEDGLKLISKRAALMQELPKNGAMAAIAMSEQIVLKELKHFEHQVTIAAINGPENVVISGDAIVVKKITSKFAAKGIETKELQVSHAFHSHLLEPMLSDFEIILHEIKFSRPTITLVSNLTGSAIDNEILNSEYWIKHTRNAVRFNDGINALIDDGINNFIEIGPQPILLGMLQKCIENTSSKAFLPSLRKDKSDWMQLLESLAILYVSGTYINWKEFDKDYNRKRVKLPTYPFQRKRYWASIGKYKNNNISLEKPLIGEMISSSIKEGEIIFNSTFSVNSYPYFLGHKVYGHVIIPGAAYVSMAFAAANDTFALYQNNKSLLVEHVVIERELMLSTGVDNADIEVQTVIEPSVDDKYKFTISSKVNTQDWILHASGYIKLENNKSYNKVDLELIRNRCGNPIATVDIYKYFEVLGLEYSDAFQGISELKSNAMESFGVVNLPESALNQGYIIHPALLDSSFQIMAAIEYSNDTRVDELYLPFEIEQMHLNNSFIPRKIVVHAISRASTEDAIIMADLYLYDEFGSLLLEITGFSAIKVNRSKLLKNLDSQAKVDVDDLTYVIKWHEQDLQSTVVDIPAPKLWHIISEDSTLSDKLISLIGNSGGVVVSDINNMHEPLDRVVFICGYEDNIETIANPDCIYSRALELTKQLITNQILANDGKLIFVTQNAQWLNDLQSKFSLSQAPLIGLAKVINIEHPELHSVMIDIDADNIDIISLFEELKLSDASHEKQIAYRGKTRFVSRLIRELLSLEHTSSPRVIRKDGLYLITGGFGALGLEFSRWLISQGASELVLVGRSQPSSETQQLITNWTEQGIKVIPLQLDISDPYNNDKLFEEISRSKNKLLGIIHAAGVIEDAAIMHQDFDKYLKVTAPKVLGAWNLQQVVEKHNIPLDFFVSFSSASAIFGNIGQSNYAAANAFLNSLAFYQRQKHIPSISINWGTWGQIGLAAKINKTSQKQLLISGVGVIEPKIGIEVFAKILKNFNEPEIIISNIDWEKFVLHVTSDDMYAEVVKHLPKRHKISYDVNNELVQSLINAETSLRNQILSNYLASEIKIILGLPDDAIIDRKAGVASLGMDSLMSVELRNRLTQAFGNTFSKDLPATLLFNYPNIDALSNYLLSEVLLLEDKNIVKKENTQRPKVDEPIAIIGMSCRLPGGANNIDAYWDLLNSGCTGILEVPKDRYDVDTCYDPDPLKPGKLYCKYGGFLNGNIYDFDASFFDISNNEAESIDPQQRLLLELSWEALENANIPPYKIYGTETGVFLGASSSEYANLLKSYSYIDAYSGTGASHSAMAGRISYTFGLKGPSYVIDTVCSSSLVAIHQACTSLNRHESNLAIVGGVYLIFGPETAISLCKGTVLSSDGVVRSFDNDANGYVLGEGAGIIILKRLSDAVKDNDSILAVIKGSAVNQNGHGSGLSITNAIAQQEVIIQALENSNLEPKDIDYIEAHGTATKLGDSIELEALFKVFDNSHTNEQPLIISSVKPNVGHLISGAGMSEIIKAILCMQHEKIPPQLNFKEINNMVNTPDSFRYIISENGIPWQRGARKRIAGISGFGFQGTNAHVIIEEPPLPKHISADLASNADVTLKLLTISAKTDASLRELVIRYKNLLSKNVNSGHEYLADLCYTANTRRSHFDKRLAVVGATCFEIIAYLENWLEHGKSDNVFVKDTTQLLNANDENFRLALAYVNGESIDWDLIYKDRHNHLVTLPNYPFQRKHYSIGTNIAD